MSGAHGIAIALIAGLALTGCGETCQSTCVHVYDPSECGITIAGVTAEDLIDSCVSQCERALETPGDMGNYNPSVHSPATENIELLTDQQAAAWIDCVWTVAPEPGPQPSCEQLDPKSGGICAPIPP